MFKTWDSAKAREFCVESIERYEKELEESKNEPENEAELDEDELDGENEGICKDNSLKNNQF